MSFGPGLYPSADLRMIQRVVFVFLCVLACAVGEVELDATKFDSEIFPVYQSLAVQYDSVNEISQYLEGRRELNWLTKKLLRINDTAEEDEENITFRDYVRDLAKMPSKPMENPLLYQGDIVLTLNQLDDLIDDARNQLAEKEGNPFVRAKRTLTTRYDALWETFPIPYFFYNSQVDQNSVRKALKMWTDNTCITFEENPKAQQGIVFKFGQGCSSPVGKTGGLQAIQLGDGCYVPGIIAHEIGHALGLYHEQSRYDRDDYINIDTNNINNDMISNFYKTNENMIFTYGVRYDFGSLMHYDAYSFNLYNRPSITTKDPNYFNTIGQRQSISFSDFKKIHYAYCENKCQEKLSCENGGYGCKETGCRCPDGFAGVRCELLAPSSDTCEPAELTAEETPQTLKEQGAIDCYHSITAPPGQLIKLTINQLKFNHQRLCSQDYVEIKYTDDMSVTGARLCNVIFQKEIISATNNVMIIYKSRFTRNKFNLSYEIWNPELVTTPVTETSLVTLEPANGFTVITTPTRRITAPLLPRTSTKAPETTTVTPFATPPTTTTSFLTTTTTPSPTQVPPPQPNGTVCPCQIPYFLPYPYPLPYPIPYPYPLPYPYPHPNFTQPFPYSPSPIDRTKVEEEKFPLLKNTTTRPMIRPLSLSAATITISAVNVSWPYTACEKLQANATIPYKNSDSIIVGNELGSALTSCIQSSMAKIGEQKFKADLFGEKLPGMKFKIELAIDVDFTDFLDHMYF